MLASFLQNRKQEVENYLSQLLCSPNREYSSLYESMNYSLLLGGKRIRPILIMAVMEALQVSWKPFMNIICAIELIHTYSLIHDDLPAMDNDDYRRGKLTNHKVYGDGMAILAGDGLLTYAFESISSNASATPLQQIECIRALAHAAGPAGMVGGQSFDLLSEHQSIPLEELVVLHQGKTGALFIAAVEIALILCNATDLIKDAFLTYAKQLGLLFQITDDILDVTGSIEELGKTPGSDTRQEKSTYVSCLGLEGAKSKANEVATIAKEALQQVPYDTKLLQQLVDYLIERSH